MKNFIIAVLSAILLTIVGYYCYVYYYKKETFQSDRYKLPIDNSKLVKEVFPNYKIVEKPVTEKDFILDYFDEHYPIDGSRTFVDIRIYYYQWYNKSEIINNIRKNPEKITTLFNDYKSDFYNLVSFRAYRNSNIKYIIELLIMSYDDFYKNPDLVNQNMKNIYGSMNASVNNKTYENPDFYIDKIISPQSLETFENIYNDIDSKLSVDDSIWFYNFWARRYKEGNIKQTIAVLREVSDHYNLDFEESDE
jgi:hypothetical protein